MTGSLDELTLSELIGLHLRLSETLKRRFERPLALLFTDIVGSTPYFAQHGDQAGRALHQRHLELLRAVLADGGGRLVDVAGDGAFTCFPSVAPAADAAVALQRSIAAHNEGWPPEHRLAVRVGVHWGHVLADDTVVSGEAVNLCARVAASAAAGEVRLTEVAFLELPGGARLRCRSRGLVTLKGLPAPVPLMTLEWADPNRFPTHVRIEEADRLVALPERDVVTFGRMKGDERSPGNDVVLEHPDPARRSLVSRWHFEVRRAPTGLALRALAEPLTEVDGAPVKAGDEVPIAAGTVVRLSGGALTLRFVRLVAGPADGGGSTVLSGGA